MEVSQRDREKGWSKLLSPLEAQARQELQLKGIGDGRDSLFWLDRELPNLQDASNLQVPAAQFDESFRLLMGLEENESIVMVFPAMTEVLTEESKPVFKSQGQVWFTSHRFMAVRSDAAGLLFYTIALNNIRLDAIEASHMKETVRSWLRSVLQGKVAKENLAYPVAYGEVQSLSVSGLADPNGIATAEFKTANSPQVSVRVAFGRPVIPERVWLANSFERGPTPVIFCKPYPCKPEVQENLLEKRFAVRDEEGRVVFPTLVHAKLFVDMLRR
ncbi:MAG: hypothetical protein ACE14S_12825 [Candidatus Bathyarchaeia archaeon]